MGRPKEFDRQEVLERAMWVFWEKGYRATSLVDLEQATELLPGSIYNAFGSKKGLFLAVVDYYIDRVVGWRIESYLEPGEPLEAIETFLRTAYEGLAPEEMNGCLLTNSATEIAAVDLEVQTRVSAGFSRIDKAFHDRLQDAQDAGEIPADKDVTSLALQLCACYQGCAVIARLTKDKARLAAITDAAMMSLK